MNSNIRIISDYYQESCVTNLWTQLNEMVDNAPSDSDPSLATILGPLFAQCRAKMTDVSSVRQRDIPARLDAFRCTVLEIQNVLMQAGSHDALEAQSLQLATTISDLRNYLSPTPNAFVVPDHHNLTLVRGIEQQFAEFITDVRLIADTSSEKILDSMINSAGLRVEKAINSPEHYLDIIQQHIRAVQELVQEEADTIQQEVGQLNAKIEDLRIQLRQPHLLSCSISPREASVYFEQPRYERSLSIERRDLTALIQEDYVEESKVTLVGSSSTRSASSESEFEFV